MVKRILLATILIAAIIGVLMWTGILPFSLTPPVTSGTITVVDDSNNVVPGVTVEAITTSDTFHWLGDLWDEKNNVKGLDGIIDDYDKNYLQGTYGAVDVAWADLDGNGVIGNPDLVWLANHYGLTIENTKSTNVTQQDGTCTLQYYALLRTDKYPYYSVTVSKTEYHTRTVTVNMQLGGKVIIEKNSPPTAVIQYSPTNPLVGQTVTFNGSGSTDIDGNIISYKWTLIDTDNTTHNFYTATFSYTFTKGGQASVTLVVTDDLGGQGSTTETIKIGSYNAIALIDANPTSGQAPLTVTFNGSKSYDPDGGALISYVWSFGDGSSASGSIVTHTYQNVGTYVANLTVTDDEGTTDTATVQISVTTPEIKVDCLTLLQFAPSTDVQITLQARSASTGNLMSGISFTVNVVLREGVQGDYAGTSITTDTTKSDGTVTFKITSPPYSKYSPYNMTVYYQEKVIAWFDFYVLPKIAITQVSFNYEQVYTPGSYDFSYSGSLVDAEDKSTPLTDVSAYSKTLVDEKGTAIPVEYTNWNQQGNSFTFQAKTYDYYKSYNSHTLTLTIVFKKSGYIDGVLNATAKMVAPTVMAVVESSSVPVGKDTFTIAFKDRYGQPYAGLTEQNIEVIITDPSGVSMSTATQLQYTFSGATKSITVAYTFSNPGTYKVVVKYSGLAFYQEPSVFTITTSEAPSIPPILTNPYVLGFIGLIILIALLRRRKKQ